MVPIYQLYPEKGGGSFAQSGGKVCIAVGEKKFAMILWGMGEAHKQGNKITWVLEIFSILLGLKSKYIRFMGSPENSTQKDMSLNNALKDLSQNILKYLRK